jgi:CubicO group peptidase (beta-lactamase class C family)
MKKYLPILLLLIFGCSTQPSETISSIEGKIDSLMSHSFENGLFNGTILISQNNEVTYRKSLGYANFDTKELLKPESSFYLASVSKQFTTMAVMILKERGKISYEDKLSSFFPDFPEYANEVTIRHMMTHTSGIPDHYRLDAYRVGLNNDDVYNILVNQDTLDFAPGSRYQYSNGGYVLLSMIVEKVSQQPFHEFMRDNIFTPLEMSNTLVYDQSEPEVSNRAIGFNARRDLDDYEIFTTGAGGIYSNIDDLFKWDQALNTSKLISLETLNEAYQPYILSSGDTTDYGFGWGVNLEDNWVGHSGGLSGFRTYLRRYLDTGDAIILLTNNGNAFDLRGIVAGLDNILSNEAFEFPRVRISARLRKLIESKGMDKAIEMVRQLQTNNNDEFVYDEFVINSLGYSYLQDEDVENALKIFQLNIEMRPHSGNAYDSYAEALLIGGDTAASIENYIKSVKQNPNNLNGINNLELLGVDTNEILPDIEHSEDELEEFVGKYQLEPDFILEIIREGNELFIKPTGEEKTPIFPASEIMFYSKLVDAQITFNKDDNGQVVSLTLHQNGDNDAPRID